MRLRQAATALVALLLVAALAGNVMAQRRDRDDDRRGGRGERGELVLLGEQRVGFRVDRDVIRINQSEDWYRNRAFRSLHFKAQGNDIHMMSIRLVYMNGFGEEYRVDRRIRQGDDLPIELRGERSYLRQIEMVYRARPDFRGEATIQVFGEAARRGPPGPGFAGSGGGRDWVELGCGQVTLIGKDRDSIRVGRREGRFKSIRLSVRGADVELIDVRVIYTNGEPDDIPVKHRLREGERTRPLDLRGWERSIDRIDLVYRTQFNPVNIIAKQRISQATVCVEGLQ